MGVVLAPYPAVKGPRHFGTGGWKAVDDSYSNARALTYAKRLSCSSV